MFSPNLLLINLGVVCILLMPSSNITVLRIPTDSIARELSSSSAPSNDDFDSATLITSFPFHDMADIGHATSASDDPDMGCGTNKDFVNSTVWYRFTSPATGKASVYIDPTKDQPVNFYFIMAAFTGTRGSLTRLTCATGFLSFPKMEFQVQRGVTYYIEAANNGSIPTYVGLTFDIQTVVQPGTKPWTIMYYLAGDNDISPHYLSLLSSLQHAEGQTNYSVAIMFDGASPGDSRYYAVSDNISFTSRGEVNTGNPATLIDFVDWSRETLPSLHTALIIADHGNLDGVAYDRTSDDHLTMKDLSTAFSEIVAHHGKLDVLYMDDCLMATIEGGYQVRDFVDYYISSENIGWTPILPTYLGLITPDLTPEAFTRIITSKYSNYLTYTYPHPYTISAVRLSRLPNLIGKLKTLSHLLRANMASIGTTIRDQILSQVQHFDSNGQGGITSNADELIDIYDFARLVKEKINNQEVQNAAQAVMDALKDDPNPDNRYIVPFAEFHNSDRPENDIYYEKLNQSHGVSIFFPRPGLRRSFYQGDTLDFAAGTDWGRTATISSEITTTSPTTDVVEWGSMLVDYVNTITPNASDDPNPPILIAPFVPPQQIYIPLITGGTHLGDQGAPDLTISTLAPQFDSAGRLIGLKTVIRNHNMFGGPTLPVPPAPDGTGSFFVDLFVYGPGQPVVPPTLPLSDNNTQGSRAYANVLKRTMGADITYTITQWCDSNASGAACQSLDVTSLFSAAGTYTVIVAVDSYDYVNEGSFGGETNNLKQVSFQYH